MIKRLVSVVTLASLVVSLSACMAKAPSDSSVTTSAVSAGAEYISEYSDKYFGIATNVSGNTVTCGDNTLSFITDGASLGMDASQIPSNGYLIRSIGNEAVIFATAADGLDRGARRFAHDFISENGFADGDFTVNEGIGYRVGEIRIAGNNISEYKIYTENDGNESKAYAAKELQDYIAKTVGHILPITNEKPEGKHISLAFDPSADDALGTEGYRIRVTDGSLIIEGGERNGCLNGVYTFLEKYLGWRFLTDTREYLYEADVIDLEEGLDFTDLPALEYRKNNAGTYTNDFQAKMKGTQDGKIYGGAQISHAHHGLYQLMESAGYTDFAKNPCFTADYFYEDILEAICDSIDSRVAAGQEYGVGKDFCMVDVGHLDIDSFCRCKDCNSYMKTRGGVASATVLYFANRISDVMLEKYPGIYVSAFGYLGTTEIPPKNMKANENVVISYCFYVPCNNHPVHGYDCDKHAPSWNNYGMGDEYKGWMEVADHVDAWYYPWQNWASFTTFNVYYDYKFMYEAGGRGVFSLMPYTNLWTFSELICYMSGRMMWSADTMTRESFDLLIKEFLLLSYGEGADHLYQIMVEWDAAGNQMTCWCGGERNAMMVVNQEYFAAKYDLICDYFAKAEQYAVSAEAEKFIRILSCTLNFVGISCCYDDRYLNGSEEDRAVIAERYRNMIDTWKSYNVVPDWEGYKLAFPDSADEVTRPDTWEWK